MAEAITLDPPAVASNRTELDLMSSSIAVQQEGVDWGDAEFEAVLADLRRGSLPLDFRMPNRVIRMPLVIQAGGGVTFDQARAKLQKKVSRIREEGGWLKRTVGSTPLYADIVGITLKLSGGWIQANRSVDEEAELTLETIPDFYEDEIQLADFTETSLPELTMLLTNLRGDFPARVRVVVDEDQGVSQGAVIFGVRHKNYDGASTAKSAYHANDLKALDAATKTTLSGSAGPNVVKHTSLADDWTPVCGLQLADDSFLTHKGIYRVFARLHSPNGANVKARLVYDVGDMVNPTQNDPWTFPGSSQFYIADLGEVRLDPVGAGTHRWSGQIQAKGGGLTCSVDRIWLFDLLHYQGLLRRSLSPTSFSSWVLREDFAQSAGALAGKTVAAGGGNWAGAGDTDDFTVETTGHTAQRTAVSDSNVNNGRFASAGSSVLSTMTAQVDLKFSAASMSGLNFARRYGLLLRYVDANNWFGAFISPDSGAFMLTGRVGGSLMDDPYSTGLLTFDLVALSEVANPYLAVPTAWYRIKVAIDDKGAVSAWRGFRDFWSPGDPDISYQHSSLATGGALDDGKVGIYDAHTDATACTRNFDNLLVSTPTLDAAIFASRSAQLSTDSMLRQDSTGAAYGPFGDPSGDLLRLPVSGLEGRSTELMIKASRGDALEVPDSGIDDISARANYRPSWLFVAD